MIIGWFDIVFIVILISLNIKLWRKKLNGKRVIFVGLLLFGLILPVISQIIEIQRVKMSIGIIDGFEVLYTFLKFPFYWIIGTVQLIVIGIIFGNRKH